MDLWTIRLRRTGALAVEKSGDFPTARPFAHKLHSARAILNKIRESQNQPPATGLSLFRPGSCPDDRSHRSFPIIFELSFDGRTQVIAAYKRPNESDASRWVLSDYFATAWLPSDIERAAMPLALDLGGLYEQALHRLIPTPARPQESLADLVARVELVAAKRREVERASSRLAKEIQFNRKVEINAHLRQLKNELEELTGR